MSKLDIIEMHKDSLDFLLKWQLEHENFYFVPRKINRDKRLDKSMYFCGNKDYIVLTFWNKADKDDRIYMINWDCNTSGKVSITLCCQNDSERLSHIVAIKDMIEVTGKKFDEIRECSEDGYADIDLFTLDVLNYEAERVKWIESLVTEYTTEAMTPVEKMGAICAYLKGVFVYSPVVPYEDVDGFMHINVLAETASPFERFYWGFVESPTILEEIAERLEFENIVRLTGKEHAWIAADYDGETYSYSVCPPVVTGYVEEITYVDFSQY